MQNANILTIITMLCYAIYVTYALLAAMYANLLQLNIFNFTIRIDQLK